MADLTICGAGIFGLSVAWVALQRGASVKVIDPNGPGEAASGGIVGALQPHTPDPWNEKKQFQLESLLQAETFWAEVDETSGIASGYGRVGRVQPLMSDKDVALASSRIGPAVRNWGKDATWSVKTNDDKNWHPPSPTGLFVHDTFSAILHPRRATESLAGAIRSRGGTIAADGAITPPVIWAHGWRGLLELSDDLGKQVGNGVKGQALLLDYNASGMPQIYADGLHVIPHFDGTVAIGSTSEREFDDPHTTDDKLDEIHARACAILPAFKGAAVLTRWAGVRPRAMSRAPLLGPWPKRPGHFIANGGFKIGFGMAPKCAEVIVDLALEGEDGIPAGFHTNGLL